jgi:hypothetical protein
MRFRELLRAAVLLSAGAASALAVISIYGTTQEETNTLLFVALAWWLVAAVAGLWVGRRLRATPGIARLLADARSTTTLPELEPGSVMFNRLWPIGVFAVTAGAIGLALPSVPAVATGYALLVALSWRRQAAAVEAIEHRDGVEFWLDRSSPFRPPRLLRLPGLRKVEPMPGSEREPAPLR